jgi:tRNA pseudouridine13 synthase
MWGRGRTHNEADAARSDRSVVDRFPEIRDGLERAGLEMGCRALRAVVRDLAWARTDDALILEFQLGRGVYATAIVREIIGESPA